MALLMVLVFLGIDLYPVNLAAEDTEGNFRAAVLYDPDSPENSMGVINDQVIELGDLFMGFKVILFDPPALVLQEVKTGDVMRFPEGGFLDPESLQKARRLFVVKQLHRIYEAQMHYYNKFREHYAPDLKTLTFQGFLPDGFQSENKQSYRFEILESKSEEGGEPIFLALASPRPEIQPEYFFVMDQLGAVRFAETRSEALWGPVWDYADHSQGPPNRFIGVQ